MAEFAEKTLWSFKEIEWVIWQEKGMGEVRKYKYDGF